MSPRLKRALWCRWFHRWRMARRPVSSVTSSIPGQPGALRLTAGPHRTSCDACDGHNYGRAYQKWLAS